MKKLIVALVAGFMSLAVAGAYAADDMKKGDSKKESSMSKGDKKGEASKDDMNKDDTKKKGKGKKDDK